MVLLDFYAIIIIYSLKEVIVKGQNIIISVQKKIKKRFRRIN